MVKAKQYIVANPRGIPQGIRLLEFHGKEWYEGDAFVRPSGMSDYGWQRLVGGGFVVEKEGDG